MSLLLPECRKADIIFTLRTRNNSKNKKKYKIFQKQRCVISYWYMVSGTSRKKWGFITLPVWAGCCLSLFSLLHSTIAWLVVSVNLMNILRDLSLPSANFKLIWYSIPLVSRCRLLVKPCVLRYTGRYVYIYFPD